MERNEMIQELVNGQQVQVIEKHQETIQSQAFIVYYTDNNMLFINANLAQKFGITNKGKGISIRDEVYIQVYREDIDYIIKESNGALVPEYKYYEMDKENKPTDYDYAKNTDGIIKNNYYTYYEDIENNELYVNEEILKKLDLTNKKDPKIIQGKNCYPITKDQIDEIAKRTGYIGQKQSIIKKHKQKEVGLCELNGDLFIPQSIAAKNNEDNKNKKIKVDGEIYTKISKEDLENIKKSFSRENIDLTLKKLTIQPKAKDFIDDELAAMLKETSTTPPTEPSFEK